MLKQIKISLLAILLVLMLFSCASLKNAEAIRSMKNIAIVEVKTNKEVIWYDDRGDSNKTSLFNKGIGLAAGLVKGKDMKEAMAETLNTTKTLIDKADPKIYDEIAKVGFFNVLDKSTVTGSGVYANAKESKMADMQTKEATGYKVLNYRNDNILEALSQDLGIDGFCFMDVQFYKDMNTGIGKNGTMKGVVYIILTIVDEKNKIMWQDTRYQRSDETIAILNGLYDSDELNNLLEQACGKALEILFQNMKMELEQI